MRFLAELVEGCRAGEADAVEDLVARFQPWALELAAALLNDNSLAQDVVQESFLAALEKLSSLREAEAFPGWFSQIIRTQAARANRKRTELPIEDETAIEDTDLSPREQLQRKELQSRVRRAVERLPETVRETAELCYFHEMKHGAIAAQLGVPIGTVKRRLHDARRKLKTMLNGIVEEEKPPKAKRKSLTEF